jgi:plastocyanin
MGTATRRVEAKPHRVTISLDASTGDLTYSPSALRVKRGDSIVFLKGTDVEHFSVVFNQRSPGDKLYLRDSDVDATLQTLKIDKNAAIGTYHYAVAAVAVSARDQVFIDSECGQVGVSGGGSTK